MKHQVKATLTALALCSAAGLAVSCGAPYDGIKGTVVKAEHEICGVELSMDNVAFGIQSTKGGTSGSKSGSGGSTGGSGGKTTKPQNDAPASSTVGGSTAGVAVTAGVAGVADSESDKKKPSANTSTKPAEKKKPKSCKEKWELEVKDSSGTVHEVKVDRRVYSACGVNFAFPKCAD